MTMGSGALHTSAPTPVLHQSWMGSGDDGPAALLGSGRYVARASAQSPATNPNVRRGRLLGIRATRQDVHHQGDHYAHESI